MKLLSYHYCLEILITCPDTGYQYFVAMFWYSSFLQWNNYVLNSVIRVVNSAYNPVMSPTQFSTHCVPNWEEVKECPHIDKFSYFPVHL